MICAGCGLSPWSTASTSRESERKCCYAKNMHSTRVALRSFPHARQRAGEGTTTSGNVRPHVRRATYRPAARRRQSSKTPEEIRRGKGHWADAFRATIRPVELGVLLVLRVGSGGTRPGADDRAGVTIPYAGIGPSPVCSRWWGTGPQRLRRGQSCDEVSRSRTMSACRCGMTWS